MNGIGQSLAALGRALGPMTGAPLFALTADHGIHQLVVCVIWLLTYIFSPHPGKVWPVNYHFTFDFMAVLAVLTAAISLLLPKTIEKKRDTIESAKVN